MLSLLLPFLGLLRHSQFALLLPSLLILLSTQHTGHYHDYETGDDFEYLATLKKVDIDVMEAKS